MQCLQVQNLTKDFGGLRANNDISFSLKKGELLSIIGPNGAGKTTLFNCLSGLLPVTSGRIIFEGRDITAKKAHESAQLGIARTFQIYAASGDLTVEENVMVGCFMRTRSTSSARDRAIRIMDELNLLDVSGNLVSKLPVVAQKRVTMATALGTEPALLLLDEVAAGLNSSEIEEIIADIKYIHGELGVTIMLIEHVMKMVMNLSQRVIVLDYGKKIAEDIPEAVASNPEVIKAYLGERYVREHIKEWSNS